MLERDWWWRWISGKSTSHQMPRRSASRGRAPRIERLEGRHMMAIDLGQISGTVLNDLQNDGNASNDVAVSGLTVTLFRDGGNGVFNSGGADDTQVATDVTDSSGQYAFPGLIAGRYFVRLTPSSTLQLLTGADVATVDISSLEAMGSTNLTVDSFTTSQTASVTRSTSIGPAVSNATTLDDSAVVGGERDLSVDITSGVGQMELISNFLSSGILKLRTDSGVLGFARVTWDGNDNDGATVAGAGLAGQNVADGGNNTAFALNVAADKSGASLIIRVFSGSGNSSTATVPIVDTDGVIDGDASEEITVPFTSFVTATGTGANFASVGAIQIEIDMNDPGNNGLDADLSLVGVVGYTTKTANYTVYNRMSLGNRVWADQDNDGVLDSGESGIANVLVNLYRDTNNDGDFDTGTDTFVVSNTTDSTGTYLFTNLLPGNYLVQIAQANFSSGPLLNLISSTGNGTAPDPDDNVNNDDNGTQLTGQGAVSLAITLVGDAEPINDGDTDNDSNLTVDFGFFGFDLVINKDVDQATIAPNGSLTYSITVTNNGPSTASGVSFTDTLPGGVTFTSGSTSVGSVNHASGTVTANLGNIASGASVTVTILVSVGALTTGTLLNTSTVSAANEINTNNNTDTATTTLTPRIDLAITKVDNDQNLTLAPGGTIVYTLQATNNGPSAATGVTVVDTLPTGVTFNSGASSPAPSVSGQTLTYNVGNLASGASTTITIGVTISSAFVGTLTNTAIVSGNETETTQANNSASAQSTVAVTPASISGYVYVDIDNDGVFDSSEVPIANVLMTLSGSDFTGASVSRTAVTNAQGFYQFLALNPGSYQVVETQPTFFPDGRDTLGSASGTLGNDNLSAIVLSAGTNATAYNFGELPPTLTKRRFLASSVN